VLADPGKLPLFIASDIVVGESSMYADYIIPDLSFYERWEFHGSHPNNIWKVQPVRNPAIAPVPETIKAFGEEMPISLEAFMLAVAEKMGLSGFGPEGLGGGQDFRRPEDFYLRMVANIAWGEKKDGSDSVPEASDEELEIFERARRHLPCAVFDLEKWRTAVGSHWRRVVYVLNRGGRYQDYEKAFDGERVKNAYGKQINLYCEKVAKSKDSMTGHSISGMATYRPIADSLGRPFSGGPDDLVLITHREIFHTKSRTPGNPWLRELYPENTILINALDARRLGLRSGDRVRVVSDSNPEGLWQLPNFGKRPMVGRLQVIQGIRPGVISFSLGHGHWAYGASDVQIDGRRIPGDPRRSAGVHANAAMAVDPHLRNVCLQDLVGGSVSFYDSPVRLIRET
jgi:anaerobic selenocysteine-containing dehydrogenase